VRSILREFFVYGVGDALVKLALFLTLPLYTRILSPGDYGVLTFLLTAVALSVAVLGVGSDSVYARFFFAEGGTDGRRVLTTTWMAFLGGWSAIAVAVACLTAAPIAQAAFGAGGHATAVVLALAAVPCILVNVISGQVLRNQFRPTAFVLTNLGATVVEVGLGLLLATAAHLGVNGFLGGILAAEAGMVPIRLWMARGLLQRSFSPHLLRRLVAYGAPLVPASVAYWAVATADRFLLARMSGLRELGLYGVANAVSGVLLLAVGAVGQAWSPRAVALYEQRRAEAPRLFGRALTLLLGGMGALCVGVTVFADRIVAVMAAPAYRSAASAVAPLALALVAYAATQITVSGITLTGRTRYVAIHSVAAAAVNIGLCLALIPRYGMIGAAWATTAAYLLLAILYLVTSQRLWAVEYEVRRALALCVAIAAFALTARVLPGLPAVLDVAMRGAYCLIFVGFAIAVTGLRAGDVRVRAAVLAHG